MRLFHPEFADELVVREAFERLQSAGEIVCADKLCEMCSQLGMGFVEIALFSRVLDRTVHALDLPIGPGMLGFG